MQKVLNMDLVYMFFGASNMHRWNDKIRPIDLTELDKQAHKAAIAWVLGKYEEESGGSVDWRALIENLLYSFIQRVTLTDLKPELFHRIERERKQELNTFVLQDFDSNVPNCDTQFRDGLKAYLDSEENSTERAITDAAHYLATLWEFNLIEESNRKMYETDQIRADLMKTLELHSGVKGVPELSENKVYSFTNLIGQLRFQKRWAKTPRVPETTVLGHSLMVASMIFMHDLDSNANDSQVYNDFFTALFHDLPEVLTKDVISPIKLNVGGLVDILDEYEHELVESKIMPLLPESWHDDLRFMIYDPFSTKDSIDRGFCNGPALKTCDLLAAYIEAHVSMCYGIKSATLENGEKDILRKLNSSNTGIDVKELIKKFNEMHI